MTAPRITVRRFRDGAARALADPALQQALEGATAKFTAGRRDALATFPESDRLRDRFKEIRAATLARLGEHLETFERNAVAAGTRVHWAGDAEEAARIVTDIALAHGVTLAVKSKSMATEEIRLNPALEAAGVTPVETDLGEWLVQLAGEPPSHIIAPAIHMPRQKAAELLSREAGRTLPADDIPLLTAEARRLLREKFLAAGMGITGGNLLVAETGSLVLVTNEGNGRMAVSTPPVQVAVVGIEKIAPTWDDAAVWLSLLARSATGQPLSIYTGVVTGPARPDEPDGPRETHVVLLDHGRSDLLGTEYEEMLQCIRCGACVNACPVYREAGGHAYASPYSGPVGAVISPLLFGLDAYEALPQASTLCGACLEVCPARIDIPRMLLALRRSLVDGGRLGRVETRMERTAASVLGKNRMTTWAMRAARLLLWPWLRDGRLRPPRFLHPAPGRDLPAPAARPFRQIWRDRLSTEDPEP